MNRIQRKQQLIAQGALHRAEALLAKQALDSSLQPAALRRNMLQHIIRAGTSVLGAKAAAEPAGTGMQRLLPLVTAGVSLLARRKPRLKAFLNAALAAGALASAAIAIARPKAQQTDIAPPPG